ncbi:MAG: ABC transporter substrate-binding protein [Dehalococcoidia bacterium]|nr:ABC transporter substrate-binding protein [Dehalococcoidia bacterium]
MTRTRDALRLSALLMLVALFAALVIACGDDDDDDDDGGAGTSTATSGTGGGGSSSSQNLGDVNVMGIWGSEELTNFESMVAPWQTENGGKVNFTGTRNITAELTLRVEGGNPPDIAIPAEVGLFQQFAQDGKLISLDQCDGLEELVRDNYPDAFIDLGTVDDKLYGFFMKADTKATVWYSPQAFEDAGVDPLDADASFDDLLSLSDDILDSGLPPWSMGLESAETSGWPGSDWIQQIILNEDGEELYDGLVDGSIPFTDDRVKDAWEKFGQVALTDGYTVQGGATGINATNFQDSTFPPFQDPPQAAMVYLGGFASTFITSQFPDAQPGTDFDFFTFPGGEVTGSANIVYAFNNNPATCSFLSYLAGDRSQSIWVEAGGFTSVNTAVNLDSYPDEIARRQAEQLLEADTFRFDLDDAIGGGLQQAYFTGVTQYLTNPGQLDAILQSIEAAR